VQAPLGREKCKGQVLSVRLQEGTMLPGMDSATALEPSIRGNGSGLNGCNTWSPDHWDFWHQEANSFRHSEDFDLRYSEDFDLRYSEDFDLRYPEGWTLHPAERWELSSQEG
jgi:hypothetical protein